MPSIMIDIDKLRKAEIDHKKQTGQFKKFDLKALNPTYALPVDTKYHIGDEFAYRGIIAVITDIKLTGGEGYTLTFTEETSHREIHLPIKVAWYTKYELDHFDVTMDNLFNLAIP